MPPNILSFGVFSPPTLIGGFVITDSGNLRLNSGTCARKNGRYFLTPHWFK
jgi:hypothetical protein